MGVSVRLGWGGAGGMLDAWCRLCPTAAAIFVMPRDAGLQDCRCAVDGEEARVRYSLWRGDQEIRRPDGSRTCPGSDDDSTLEARRVQSLWVCQVDKRRWRTRLKAGRLVASTERGTASVLIDQV